jgi:signal transduction histidine kinase
VIAPASQAGTYPDIPYVNEGRKLDKESVHQVNDNTIVAMYPVRFYNSDTGAQAIMAWAVVYFDMTSLAVDNAQVLSLFITTLFISLILGFILFYFLYKMIENPIRSMNVQLDQALKANQETVQIKYNFPPMQLLASNVSSALSRSLSGQEGAGNRALEHDRNREISNLVELIGFACMGIRHSDLSIAAVNQALEQRIGISSSILATQSLNELADQALRLSVKDLIERVEAAPDELAANDLDFSGQSYQIVAQAIFGTSSIAYFLIVLLPKAEGG